MDESPGTGAPPESLWARLREDPGRAPEHLALAAAARHAPAAEAWVAEQLRAGTGRDEIARAAKKHHARLARVGGAATGIGGMVTVLPDLVSLAWIQSRMVLFIAAAYGHSAHDRMRPAELLVLRDLYPTARAAREALDGTGTPVAIAYAGARRERDQALVMRLALMLGRRGMKSMGARLVPGLAIGVNAVANERDTRRLADRAIDFYRGR